MMDVLTLARNVPWGNLAIAAQHSDSICFDISLGDGSSRQILAGLITPGVFGGFWLFYFLFSANRGLVPQSRRALCVQQPMVVCESWGQAQRTQIADFPCLRWFQRLGKTLPSHVRSR